MAGHADSPTRRARRGFTIIELLIVMSIMAIIAGLVVAFWPSPPSRADADIARIAMALEQYRQEFRCYPPDTGYGLKIDAGSPHYDPGSLWRYLCQRATDPRTGLARPAFMEWPQDRMKVYEDPLRGRSRSLTDPWGRPFGFVAHRNRVVHNEATFDLFSAGRDGVTACGPDEQDPSDARPGANRAYNGRDDDGNGIVDDREELGEAARNGEEDDDSNNWSR